MFNDRILEITKNNGIIIDHDCIVITKTYYGAHVTSPGKFTLTYVPTMESFSETISDQYNEGSAIYKASIKLVNYLKNRLK